MKIHLATALLRARTAALILALLSSLVAVAKDPPAKDPLAKEPVTKGHLWKDARVIDITSERGGAVMVPLALIGGAVSKTYYWIQTDDTIYVLGPVLTRSQTLNVTLHGPTKLAVEGNSAHLLDDRGKDEKLRIVEEIARPKPLPPTK